MFTFKLGIYGWIVKLVKSNDEKLFFGDSFALGICDSHEFAIYINKNLPQQYLLRVLRHELSHAVMRSCLKNIEFGTEEICDYIADYASLILSIEEKFKKHYKIA